VRYPKWKISIKNYIIKIISKRAAEHRQHLWSVILTLSPTKSHPENLTLICQCKTESYSAQLHMETVETLNQDPPFCPLPDVTHSVEFDSNWTASVTHGHNFWNKMPDFAYSINLTRLCSESTNLCQGNKPQPKVIQDSNTDFWTNPDLGLDVCRIAPKMLWIHYLVDVSHFTKYRENRPVIISGMPINLKSPILQ